jgi:hypothetical protein
VTAGIEPLVADQFIYGKLFGDSALTAIVGSRIYADSVPQSATRPYVLFQMLSGIDRRTVGPNRLLTNLLYLVQVVAESTSYAGDMATAAKRIDAVLHAASGTTTDGSTYACVREEPFRLAERLADNTEIRRLGGRYRILSK